MQRHLPKTDRPELTLLEHDSRFELFPEFVYYDFQQPLKLPGKAMAIVAFPPRTSYYLLF